MARTWLIFAGWCLLPVAVLIAGLAGCIGVKPPLSGPPSPSSAFSSPDPKHWAQSPTVAIPAQSAPFLSPSTNHATMVQVSRSIANAIMFTPAVVQRPVAKLTIGWDEPTNGSLVHHWNLYTGYGNDRWLKTNTLYASNAIRQGQTVIVNITNFYRPMVMAVEACNSAEISNAISAPLYFGFDTNGTVAKIQGQLSAVFVADSNSVYSLSNAPLTVNQWANLASVSNRQGLVTVPLSNQTGRVLIQASR